ncbi:MAG TPA: hypothetical protein VFC47_05625 [Caulobacteraceae bacterium]|nr:hypothetical protein [Caulobacteraceae bacterium]
MTWWSDYVGAAASRERAEKAMSLPVGVASPLWLAFGAAASVGVTWWWMTRWTRAVNLEALSVEAPASAVAARTAEAAKAIVAETVAPPAEPEPAPEPAPKLVAKPKAEPEPEPVLESDDLTRLVGIGPKLADALAARGVVRFAQLAKWTAADLAEIDTALSLKGRAVRDAWVAQAKRMAAA